MPKRTRDNRAWLLDELKNPVVARNYINAALADSEEMFLIALRNVAEAHGISKVAVESGRARESLYRTLSKAGNPRLDTLSSVLSVLGLQLAVEMTTPKKPSGKIPALIEEVRMPLEAEQKTEDRDAVEASQGAGYLGSMAGIIAMHDIGHPRISFATGTGKSASFAAVIGSTKYNPSLGQGTSHRDLNLGGIFSAQTIFLRQGESPEIKMLRKIKQTPSREAANPLLWSSTGVHG
jgi:probable addiction module antidote protein